MGNTVSKNLASLISERLPFVPHIERLAGSSTLPIDGLRRRNLRMKVVISGVR